ncbi:MAG: hypothetical protein IID54_02845 [Proteobacteria bacterium]|nr:hypothetical protein [Pseudomonadota bacterium]
MQTDAFQSETGAARPVATLILTRPGRGDCLLTPEISMIGRTVLELGEQADVGLNRDARWNAL